MQPTTQLGQRCVGLLLDQVPHLLQVVFAQGGLAAAAVGPGGDAAAGATATQELADEGGADAESIGDLRPRVRPLITRRHNPFPQVK